MFYLPLRAVRINFRREPPNVPIYAVVNSLFSEISIDLLTVVNDVLKRIAHIFFYVVWLPRIVGDVQPCGEKNALQRLDPHVKSALELKVKPVCAKSSVFIAGTHSPTPRA